MNLNNLFTIILNDEKIVCFFLEKTLWTLASNGNFSTMTSGCNDIRIWKLSLKQFLLLFFFKGFPQQTKHRFLTRLAWWRTGWYFTCLIHGPSNCGYSNFSRFWRFIPCKSMGKKTRKYSIKIRKLLCT